MTLEPINYFELARAAGLTDAEAKKYKEYIWRKKRDICIQNSTCGRDSQRQRVYSAESQWESKLYRDFVYSESCRTKQDILYKEYRKLKRFETLEDAQKFVDLVTKSKTWKKLDTNEINSYDDCKRIGDRSRIEVKFLPRNSRYAGLAMIREGVIKLGRVSGLNKSVVLHELAHMVGFGSYTHGIKFRQWNVALVRRFMGRYEGDELYKAYRNEGLRMKVNDKIKTPREWLKVSEPIGARTMIKQFKVKVA